MVVCLVCGELCGGVAIGSEDSRGRAKVPMIGVLCGGDIMGL